MFRRISENFRPGCGAAGFFASILFWGIAAGCFTAVLNNYLADVRKIDEFDRGVLEFFREMPGLLLVFILFTLNRLSDWKIFKAGILVTIVGVSGLVFSSDKILITLLITIWSTGEHIIMPVRSSIAIHMAQEGREGHSLGLVTSAMNGGTVIGSAIAAIIFYTRIKYLQMTDELLLYNITWGVIIILLICSLSAIFFTRDNGLKGERPALYFRKKYRNFYALELFYGARKQIFITFAPYVLIREYGMDTSRIALLMGICALVNIFCGPLVGKLTDRFGYKNIMIYDTVILFFVCFVYGYADRFFAMETACIIVCINFVLDAVISTTSIATNLYVKDISCSQEEITSSLTTGISINHFISILAALAGGMIWEKFGYGILFSFAAVMAVANTIYAMTIPAPARNTNTKGTQSC